jgi:hypothetical protein
MLEPDPTRNRLLYHPLASEFLDSVEQWIKQESMGVSAAEELAEMRDTAIRMIDSSR